jgi:hypothetical protein
MNTFEKFKREFHEKVTDIISQQKEHEADI